jgi:hypothetical protein
MPLEWQLSGFSERRLVVGAAIALASANTRYWRGIAPTVRAQLRLWNRRAQAIPAPPLRALALAKLGAEGFNAEVAGTLATLAPRAYRAHSVKAMVALQVMYDYLDGLSEQVTPDPLSNGRHLFDAFIDAVTQATEVRRDYYEYSSLHDDGGFLEELVRAVKEHLAVLPAADAVADTLQRSAVRGAEAQVRLHAAWYTGAGAVESWAAREALGSDLEWRALLAAATSSVIPAHALIALAADPNTTREDAAALDAAYLPVSTVSTMLDGLVDCERDARTGELQLGCIQYCGHHTRLARELTTAVRQATARVRSTRRRTQHLMTLVGVVAYYTSTPEAKSERARPIVEEIHRELRPLIWPTLAIMRSWRLLKRLRARWVPNRLAQASLGGVGAAAVSPSQEPELLAQAPVERVAGKLSDDPKVVLEAGAQRGAGGELADVAAVDGKLESVARAIVNC